MTYVIPKGKHKSRFAWPAIYFGKKRIARKVLFDNTVRYNINAVDQLDWNKLFGIGYFPSHHKNSFRIAWRYLGNGHIELGAYWYQNGKRESRVLKQVPLFTSIYLELEFKDTIAIVSVTYGGITRAWSFPFKTKFLGYALHPYFGGNMSAPREIRIQMKKV